MPKFVGLVAKSCKEIRLKSDMSDWNSPGLHRAMELTGDAVYHERTEVIPKIRRILNDLNR